MVVASLLFATMAVCIKFASAAFTPGELLFYRGLIGMLLMWLWGCSRGESVRTAYPGMHAWRSVVGVLSLGGWFYSIAFLPLATAMTLNYMSSVWVAAFVVGGSLLAWNPRTAARPPRQGLLALTVLVGFGGVLMMLRPGMPTGELFAGMLGVISGLLAAVAYLQVVALGKLGEPEARTVFYFALGSAVGGALAMLVTGLSPWDWQQALWLLPIGVLAAVAQLCMTRAYNSGATLLVANLQYSGIVFGGLYSVLLFDDAIPPIGWAGMALILASGIAATVLRARSGAT